MVALMFTDIVGYSTLPSTDEKLAFELLEEHRVILRSLLPRYGGFENKTIGDAFFIEFGSPIDALQCALEIQTALYERNLFAPAHRKLQIRIGLHLGDIIASDGDSYGDPVNIAARVESMAQHGGICVTQQILDHVVRQLDLKFKRIKKVDLKNLGAPTQLYHVIMPWQDRRKPGVAEHFEVGSFFKSFTPKQAVLALWGLVLGSICVYAGYRVQQVGMGSNVFRSFTAQRSPSSVLSSPPAKIDLSEQHWFYRLKGHGEWKDFSLDQNWKYADDILGSYELRTEFQSPVAIEHPAMVLGLVADTYRAYVNGHFVGGSGNYSSIEFFGIDPQFLFTDKPNEILIQAYTEGSLSPGLTVLTDVGSFVSDFDSAYHTALSERTRFHVMRSVYLAIALITSFMSFLYFCYRPKKLRHLYFSIYLLLGALLLSYYNVYVSSALPYPFHRFLKVTALSLSSVVLFSAWLNSVEREKWEHRNNIAGLCFTIFSAISLVVYRSSALDFIERYDLLFYVCLAYSLGWNIYAGLVAWKKRNAPPKEEATWFDRAGTLVFGTASTLLIVSSLKKGILPAQVQNFLFQWTYAIPFIFAIFVVVTALFDFIAKSKKIAYKRDRENLILEIYHIAEKSGISNATVSRVLERLCEFVSAERATLYLASQTADSKTLYAEFSVGGVNTQRLLKREISSEIGIIGHVCTYRTPILIEELEKDARFRNHRKSSGVDSTYKTGSCMIFPLISGTRFLGVLTLADKSDTTPFNRNDFMLVHIISGTLALLIQSSQSQSRAS
jgi:class 3 adenylate cyclase